MTFDPTEQPMKVPGQIELELDDCPPHGIERPTLSAAELSAANLWSMTPAQLRDVIDLPIVDDLDHDLHDAARRELLFRCLGSYQARKYLQ